MHFKAVVEGRYYEFDRMRNIARPGAPLDLRVGFEIGLDIPRPLALGRVRNGKDVYTKMKNDAYRLASDVAPGSPIEEIDADTTHKFRHFHAADTRRRNKDAVGSDLRLKDYGHVFFGDRHD